MGYGVIETADGDAALTVCRSLPDVRVAILYLTVPGKKGGKDIIIPLRALFPDLPVIACSGFSEGGVISRPKDFGFTSSLQKPFLPDELEAHLVANLGETSN